MRALYTDFYRRGRGFSTVDLIRVINRITRKSYEDFFRRYVSGVEVPPYDTFFGYAGYQAVRTTLKFPNLGVNLNERGGVTGVPPGYDAAAAPLRPGDFITSVDGQSLEGRGSGAVFRMLGEKMGKTVRLKIRRGDDERDLDLPVATVEFLTYRLVESKPPTPEQLKIREGWLKR
jgi:predicted metalloprotease with PDZ domain